MFVQSMRSPVESDGSDKVDVAGNGAEELEDTGEGAEVYVGQRRVHLGGELIHTNQLSDLTATVSQH